MTARPARRASTLLTVNWNSIFSNTQHFAVYERHMPSRRLRRLDAPLILLITPYLLLCMIIIMQCWLDNMLKYSCSVTKLDHSNLLFLQWWLKYRILVTLYKNSELNAFFRWKALTSEPPYTKRPELSGLIQCV